MPDQRRVVGAYVGIDTYLDYPKLRFCAADALELSNCFTETIPHDRVEVVVSGASDDTALTKRELTALLQRIADSKLDESDLAIWYFAGHGFSSDGRDYLVVADSTRDDVATCLTVDNAVASLSASGAGTAVMIIDACRLRQVRDAGNFGKETAELARRRGVMLFFGCSPGEVCQEIDSLGHGVFTSAMIDAFKGVTHATPLEIDAFVSQRVKDICRREKLDRQAPYTAVGPLQKAAEDIRTGRIYRLGRGGRPQCVLILGPSNSGKTTLGQFLATSYGYVHVEMSAFAWQRLKRELSYNGSLQDYLEQVVWRNEGKKALAQDVINAQDALDGAERLVLCGARTFEEVELLRGQDWDLRIFFLFSSEAHRWERFCESGEQNRYRMNYEEFIRKDMREFSWGLSDLGAQPTVEMIINDGEWSEVLAEITRRLELSVPLP